MYASKNVGASVTVQSEASLASIFQCLLGDSRAVLSRGDVAIPLTDDHKAAREDETVYFSSDYCPLASIAICLADLLVARRISQTGLDSALVRVALRFVTGCACSMAS